MESGFSEKKPRENSPMEDEIEVFCQGVLHIPVQDLLQSKINLCCGTEAGDQALASRGGNTAGVNGGCYGIRPVGMVDDKNGTAVVFLLVP